MAVLASVLLIALQPPAGTQSDPAASEPESRFILCPADRRCPRGVIASAPSGTSGTAFSIRPNYGSVSLRSGFTPDPHIVRVTAGGSRAATSIHADCGGFIDRIPDLRVTYSAGTLPLLVTARGDNVSLVINAPDGRWYCSPLGEAGVTYRFDRPASGQFDIWVGSAAAGTTSPARLELSEIDPAPAPAEP